MEKLDSIAYLLNAVQQADAIRAQLSGRPKSQNGMPARPVVGTAVSLLRARAPWLITLYLSLSLSLLSFPTEIRPLFFPSWSLPCSRFPSSWMFRRPPWSSGLGGGTNESLGAAKQRRSSWNGKREEREEIRRA
jgi:hypothetical protein